MNADPSPTLPELHRDAFGWALHCCHGDRCAAEDVLQTAYARFYSGAAVPGGQATLKTWWFGVILNCARESSRKRMRVDLLFQKLRAWSGLGIHDSSEISGGQPDTKLQAGERAEELRAVLKVLPERQAEVLHLVFYQDLTIAEAAAVMRVSLGTARQHYERGKARLRSLLTPTSSPSAYDPAR